MYIFAPSSRHRASQCLWYMREHRDNVSGATCRRPSRPVDHRKLRMMKENNNYEVQCFLFALLLFRSAPFSRSSDVSMEYCSHVLTIKSGQMMTYL